MACRGPALAFEGTTPGGRGRPRLSAPSAGLVGRRPRFPCRRCRSPPLPPAAVAVKNAVPPPNSLTALQYAAEGGHPIAQWRLGRMYADGDGVDRDDLRAFDYFSRIANQHAEDSPSAPQAQIVANAFVALGRYYRDGIPNTRVKSDRERAREMFHYAASYFGNADAQYNLARMYLDGVGTQRDPKYAARWLGAGRPEGPVPGAGAARADAVQWRPAAEAGGARPDVADAGARQCRAGRDLDQRGLHRAR